MNSTPGNRVRLLAVLSLIVVAGISAYVLVNGSSSASNTAGTQTTLHKQKPQTTTTKKAQPEKRNKSKHTTSAVGVNALDDALLAHPVVVVSVYAPNVVTDTEAMKEAKAGAARAGVGFVAFNIFDEKIARQLGDLIGERDMTNPEVLFFERGRKLVFALEGFADSQVVAQAARNVYPPHRALGRRREQNLRTLLRSSRRSSDHGQESRPENRGGPQTGGRGPRIGRDPGRHRN